jgi:hypothetical protein
LHGVPLRVKPIHHAHALGYWFAVT